MNAALQTVVAASTAERRDLLIFGAVPRFQDVLEHVVRLETRLNAG